MKNFKFSYIVRLSTLIIGIVLVSGCTPLDTSNPIPVSLEELDCSENGVADINGKYVSIEGDLHVPAILMCGRGECQLDLYADINPANRSNRQSVRVAVKIGNEPNTFQELPDQYTNDDFIFKDTNGVSGGHTDRVRIKGRFIGERQSKEYFECRLEDPISIEKQS